MKQNRLTPIPSEPTNAWVRNSIPISSLTDISTHNQYTRSLSFPSTLRFDRITIPICIIAIKIISTVH